MMEKFNDGMPTDLANYLENRDKIYQRDLKKIDLFDPKKTATWSFEQKQKFAGAFYHVRGHFIQFMWYIANFSTDPGFKAVIVENIQEELGSPNKCSHEYLYSLFAKECGIDIHDEIMNETHYLPEIKKINDTLLKWLIEHDEDTRMATFSAYERLDNLDYTHLLQMAQSLNVSKKALTFYNVHIHASHFDSTLKQLTTLWEQVPNKVTLAFEFIYETQLNMWQSLSDSSFL